MTLRRRLTLWYGAVLLVSVLLAAWPAYYEVVLETSERTITNANAKVEFREILRDMAKYCLPPMIVGLFIGWWMIRRALRPLEDVIADVYPQTQCSKPK